MADERTFLLTIARYNVFEGSRGSVAWVTSFPFYGTNTMDRLRSELYNLGLLCLLLISLHLHLCI